MTVETRPVPFSKVAIIGIGMIGASIAHSIRRHGLADEVAVCDSSEAHRHRALELVLCKSVTDNPAEVVKDADLVILCTPIGAYKAIAETMAASLKPGAVVTDVGSSKGSVVKDVKPFIPEGVHFIPGHPVAGIEKSGPDAGFAELFEGRWCILTPDATADQAAVERLKSLWEAMGSSVEIMDVDHHDMVLAITSHLPHLIAYTIVGTATDLEDDLQAEVVRYSASGFRDFTRIAGSDPTMWRDVFLNNKEAVLEMLGRFTEDLTALQRAIRRGQGDTLYEVFTRTRELRKKVVEAKQA